MKQYIKNNNARNEELRKQQAALTIFTTKKTQFVTLRTVLLFCDTITNKKISLEKASPKRFFNMSSVRRPPFVV
jgi:hypothetical protein